MPSKHSRSLARGRPPLGEGGCWGKYGAIRCHCSSERTRLVIRAMIDSFGRSLKRHQPNRAIPVLKPSLAISDDRCRSYTAPLNNYGCTAKYLLREMKCFPATRNCRPYELSQ